MPICSPEQNYLSLFAMRYPVVTPKLGRKCMPKLVFDMQSAKTLLTAMCVACHALVLGDAALCAKYIN